MLDCANTFSVVCHCLLQHSLLQSVEFLRKRFPQFHSLCWLLLQHQHWQSLKGAEICSSARIFLEQCCHCKTALSYMQAAICFPRPQRDSEVDRKLFTLPFFPLSFQSVWSLIFFRSFLCCEVFQRYLLFWDHCSICPVLATFCGN